MIKKILYSENDLKDYLREAQDKNPIVNAPIQYPCILVNEIYKIVDNDFRRTLDLLYKEDVKKLFHQLEESQE